jgi:Nucleotidyl transferase AbiEii toxin, Type IV TA system
MLSRAVTGSNPSGDSPIPFNPNVDVLPPAQLRLWPELSQTPEEFTLYGGTAIALQLGHRPSLDFDFFAWRPFAPNNLMQKIPCLRGATVRQAAPDTLTVTVDRGGPVQLSFFGGLDLGQVARADTAIGPGIKVASLIDLAGFKVAVVTQRAELKDYIDVHSLLIKAAISLADMLASAGIIYGSEFNPLLALKALAYHEDRALAGLSAGVRRDLAEAVRRTDPRRLPRLTAVRQRPDRS